MLFLSYVLISLKITVAIMCSFMIFSRSWEVFSFLRYVPQVSAFLSVTKIFWRRVGQEERTELKQFEVQTCRRNFSENSLPVCEEGFVIQHESHFSIGNCCETIEGQLITLVAILFTKSVPRNIFGRIRG